MMGITAVSVSPTWRPWSTRWRLGPANRWCGGAFVRRKLCHGGRGSHRQLRHLALCEPSLGFP